jgi:hypothetical protein
MNYQYKKELQNFFIAFKMIPEEQIKRTLIIAGIEATNLEDFINETEKLVNPDLSELCDYIGEMSVNQQSSIFEKVFNELDVETMNGILKDTPYVLVDKVELDEDLSAAQNSLDDAKEKLNKLMGG